jgi:hypothetical protein
VTIGDAARNNAELCDIVGRTHNVAGAFAPDAWTSAERTPPLSPDAVTLRPGVPATGVLARIDGSPGCSVKDSFADLDLRPHGFEILFAAEWIQRPPTKPKGDVPPWTPVRDAQSLARWSAAWADAGDPTDLFRPALLRHPDIVVLASMVGPEVVAGAVLNRSTNVVGLSNVFVTNAAPDDVWPGCLDAITATFSGLPIVGYEPAESLATARHYGFSSLGPLWVWIRPEEQRLAHHTRGNEHESDH